MTSIATVLGLVPMSLGIGEGSEMQVPLARVVIGGLTTSLLITLVLVPHGVHACSRRVGKDLRHRPAAPPEVA